MSLSASLTFAYPSSVKIPIGSYQGVTAYSNGPDTGTGNGYWQCVEYIKRFYSQAMGIDTSGWYGNAWTYYGSASGRGLNAYPNRGTIPPAPGDILVYDKGSTIGTQYGHVSIVTAVRSDSIDIIEQNANPNNGFRTISRGSGNNLPNWSGMPVKGWVHKGQLVAVNSPIAGNYWSRYSYHTIRWQYRTDLRMNAANIDLVNTNGAVTSLAKNVPLTSSGSGSYSWYITQPSGQYKIKVTLLIKDSSSMQYSAASGVFYIG